MSDTTSVFYQIGQSVTSAVNSRFSVFTSSPNTFSGTQSFSTITLTGSLDGSAASAQVKSLEVIDLAGSSGKVALIGSNGVIEADSLAYNKATDTLSVANLNVTGTTTSVSTTNTEVTDKVLVLNKGGGDTAGESGILAEGPTAANGSVTSGSFTFANNVWRAGTTASDGSGGVTTTPGTLNVGGLQITSGSPVNTQNLGDYNDFIAGLNA